MPAAVTKSTLNKKLANVSTIRFCTSAGKNMTDAVYYTPGKGISISIGLKQPKGNTNGYQIQYREHSRLIPSKVKKKGAEWTTWSSWKNLIEISTVNSQTHVKTVLVAANSTKNPDTWLNPNVKANTKTSYLVFYKFSNTKIDATYDARSYQFRVRTYNAKTKKHGSWITQTLYVYKKAIVEDTTVHVGPNGSMIFDLNYKWDRDGTVVISSVKPVEYTGHSTYELPTTKGLPRPSDDPSGTPTKALNATLREYSVVNRNLLKKSVTKAVNYDSRRTGTSTPPKKSGYKPGQFTITIDEMKTGIKYGELLQITGYYKTSDGAKTPLFSKAVNYHYFNMHYSIYVSTTVTYTQNNKPAVSRSNKLTIYDLASFSAFNTAMTRIHGSAYTSKTSTEKQQMYTATIERVYNNFIEFYSTYKTGYYISGYQKKKTGTNSYTTVPVKKYITGSLFYLTKVSRQDVVISKPKLVLSANKNLGFVTARLYKTDADDVMTYASANLTYTYKNKTYTLKPDISHVNLSVVSTTKCFAEWIFVKCPFNTTLRFTAIVGNDYQSSAKVTSKTTVNMYPVTWIFNKLGSPSVGAILQWNCEFKIQSQPVVNASLPHGRGLPFAAYMKGLVTKITLDGEVPTQTKHPLFKGKASRDAWDKVRNSPGVYILRGSNSQMYKIAITNITLSTSDDNEILKVSVEGTEIE